MERILLTTDEISARRARLEGWTADDGTIRRRFAFEDFAAALAFVNRVGEIAESMDHHPDITFGWGYADIATTTHDRGGITDFDIELAARINAID